MLYGSRAPPLITCTLAGTWYHACAVVVGFGGWGRRRSPDHLPGIWKTSHVGYVFKNTGSAKHELVNGNEDNKTGTSKGIAQMPTAPGHSARNNSGAESGVVTGCKWRPDQL